MDSSSASILSMSCGYKSNEMAKPQSLMRFNIIGVTRARWEMNKKLPIGRPLRAVASCRHGKEPTSTLCGVVNSMGR